MGKIVHGVMYVQENDNIIGVKRLKNATILLKNKQETRQNNNNLVTPL